MTDPAKKDDLETTPNPAEVTPAAEVKDDKIVLTEAELKAKITDAEAKERDKLYKTLSAKEAAEKELRQKLKDFEEREAAAKAKAEEERLAKLSSEERMSEQLQKATDKVEQVNVAFNVLRKEMEDKLAAKDLEIFRERIIAANQGKCIPDMIVGNTKEELEASLEKSVARYQQIRDEIAEGLKNSSRHESNTTQPKEIPNHTKTPIPAEQSVTAAEIQDMDPEKFKQTKEAILKKYNL